MLVCPTCVEIGLSVDVEIGLSIDPMRDQHNNTEAANKATSKTHLIEREERIA
jgi:hypothetical protein